MREDLAFVVRGTAPENPPFANRGFEGRGGPEFERFGGLDIVVAVNQDGFFGGVVRGFSDDHRVAGGFLAAGVEAEGAQFFHQPIGAAPHVRRMRGLRRNAWDGDKFQQFLNSWVCIHNLYVVVSEVLLHRMLYFCPCPIRRHF